MEDNHLPSWKDYFAKMLVFPLIHTFSIIWNFDFQSDSELHQAKQTPSPLARKQK